MIPIASHRISVSRVNYATDEDGYDSAAPSPLVVAVGIRASIDTPTASIVLSGGDRAVYKAKFFCDPVANLQQEDTIIDDTGTSWVLCWARRVVALGMDYVEGELRLVVGTAP